MTPPIAVDVPLRDYAEIVKRHRVSLVLMVLMCVMAGLAVQARQGTPVEAHQRVFVRDIRNGDTDTGVEIAPIDFSLDTEAQLTRSDGVIKAIQAAAGTPMTPDEALSRLRVTAVPNTRILVLNVTLPDAAKATLAAQRASAAYLLARYDLLNTSKTAQLALLQQRSTDISNIVATINRTVPESRKLRIDVIRGALGQYNNELRLVVNTRNRFANNRLDVGRLVGETSTESDYDGWLIKGASGLAIGLASWFMLAILFDGAFRRVDPHRRSLSRSRESLPVLSRVRLSTLGGHGAVIGPQDPALAKAVASLRSFAPVSAVLAPLGGAHSLQVASALDSLSWDPDPGTSGRVVLVTPSSARAHDVRAFRRRSTATDLEIVGLIVVGP